MKGYPGTTPTVDAIAKLDLPGTCNVIPRLWRQWLRRASGKVHSIAIDILSELVYWYKPIPDIDEASGRQIGWRKKFKADKLQKSYDQLADALGHTKRQIKDAVLWLERKGYIQRDFRSQGMIANILYIDINVEAIARITHEIPSTPENSHVTLERQTPDARTSDGVTIKRQTDTETSYRDYSLKTSNIDKRLADAKTWTTISQHSNQSIQSNPDDQPKETGLPVHHTETSVTKPNHRDGRESVASLPKKKNKEKEYDSNGYWLIPSKGTHGRIGTLTIKVMQLIIASRSDVLKAYDDGEHLWLLDPYSDDYVPEEEWYQRCPLKLMKHDAEREGSTYHCRAHWFNFVAEDWYEYWGRFAINQPISVLRWADKWSDELAVEWVDEDEWVSMTM